MIDSIISAKLALQVEISVVIPVYNAAPWLDECLASVTALASVTEIICIDDGSTDSSRSILSTWTSRDARIQLYHHPDHQNHGRSASRNLGIQKSTYEWIAFLDADDVYTADRFSALPSEMSADGYYGTIGEMGGDGVTSIPTDVASSELLDYLIRQSDRHFSLLSLTVRRACLMEIERFDETLAVGEDTDLIWRLAHRYQLLSVSSSTPLALRRRHGANSYSDPLALRQHRFAFYKKWKNQKDITLSPVAKRRIHDAYVHYHPRIPSFFRPVWRLLLR